MWIKIKYDYMKWDKEQEETLRSIFHCTPDKELEQHFPGMKVNRIKAKARRMGLIRDRIWTPDDEAVLIINFHTANRQELARELNRSYYALSNKYARLVKDIKIPHPCN